MDTEIKNSKSGKKLVLSPLMRLQLRHARRKAATRENLNWETIHARLSALGHISEVQIDPAKVLAKRAAELARPLESANAPTTAKALVVVQQANCQIAFDVEFVREIIPLESVTYVPGVPEFIVGVVNARGKILTLINLEIFLQADAFISPNNSEEQKQTIVMLEIDSFEFGVICSGFPFISQHDPLAFRPLSDVMLSYRGQHLQGINPDGVLLVNLPSLVADPTFLVEQN